METWPDALRTTPDSSLTRAALASSHAPNPLGLARHLLLQEGSWDAYNFARLARLTGLVSFTHLTAESLEHPNILLDVLRCDATRTLSTLIVRRSLLTREIMRAVCQHIERQHISLSSLTLSHNTCHVWSADELIRHPSILRSITHLDLSHTHLSSDRVQRIARLLPSLRSLVLQEAHLSDFEASALLSLPDLHHLDLSRCDLSPSALLNARAHASSLRSLNLSSNPLGDDGLTHFLHAPIAQQLHHLNLADTLLHTPLRIPPLAQLQTLSLARNALHGASLDALLTALSASPQLHTLSLSGNSLQDSDLHTLASSPALSSLESLSLARNVFCDLGLAALTQSPQIAKLAALDLSHNTRLRPRALSLLARSPFLGNLKELRICGMDVEERPLQKLVSSLYTRPHRVAIYLDQIPFHIETPANVDLKIQV